VPFLPFPIRSSLFLSKRTEDERPFFSNLAFSHSAVARIVAVLKRELGVPFLLSVEIDVRPIYKDFLPVRIRPKSFYLGHDGGSDWIAVNSFFEVF